MLYLLCGVISFAAFFLYDLNSVKFHIRSLHLLFAVGCAVLAAATAVCLWREYRGQVAMGFALAAAGCFGLMIYTLFFALPFADTYVEQGKPALCDRGMYALCRHPGVLWFCLMYGCLGLAWGSPGVWLTGTVYSLLNIAYVIFQDLWTFPQTFDGYGAYRKSTPFLIPTPKSLRRALKTRP